MTQYGAERSSVPPNAARRWLTPRNLGFLAVLIIAIIFVVENRDEVRTHFVFFTVVTKIWVGFLVSLVLGAILGQAASVWRRHRRDAARPR
jgi:uncharacterized integral membrane protein